MEKEYLWDLRPTKQMHVSIGLTLLEIAINRYPFDKAPAEIYKDDGTNNISKKSWERLKSLKEVEPSQLLMAVIEKGLLEIDATKRLRVQEV